MHPNLFLDFLYLSNVFRIGIYGSGIFDLLKETKFYWKWFTLFPIFVKPVCLGQKENGKVFEFVIFCLI